MEEGAHKQALPTGTRLQNHRVLGVLGIGGFGVTYLAEHVTLGQRAAIKEYLPNEFAVREGATVHPKSEAEAACAHVGDSRLLQFSPYTRFKRSSVIRGGSWSNTAWVMRSADRHGENNATSRYYRMGFRLVRELRGGNPMKRSHFTCCIACGVLPRNTLNSCI